MPCCIGDRRALPSQLAWCADQGHLPMVNSNRCAALLKLTKISRALEDAEQCIRLKPEWHKGYFRKGAVHEYVKEYKEVSPALHAGTALLRPAGWVLRPAHIMCTCLNQQSCLRRT
jgi:hypothetical protein